MKTYTKEQLIEAQHQYNLNYVNGTEDFKTPEEENWESKDTAIEQIEYLLSLIDAETE